MNHSMGRLLAGRSISAGDSLAAVASGSYWHSGWASRKSGRFYSESDQLARGPESDGGTLISVWLVPSACIAGSLLGLESLQVLWFSTTRQLTASEWAFPTFAKNRGCLSMCQAAGRFKKSKFNRWLVPPCLAAANGSSGYSIPTGQPAPAEEAGEEKWMNGASSRVQCREGFFTPQLLNDFFNWFQQCCFSITDSIPTTGQKNGLREIIGREERRKGTQKLITHYKAVTFVQIFYAELEKERERDDNLSHCSACVVERSAHVPACSQAPVHPCSLTCSLVWNQLQKAAVILCYSASPILKAAIKVWHWLKAIQLAVTVKQKLRVNWNLFFSPLLLALSYFYLEPWREKFTSVLGRVWGVRMQEGCHLHGKSSLQCLLRKKK